VTRTKTFSTLVLAGALAGAGCGGSSTQGHDVTTPVPAPWEEETPAVATTEPAPPDYPEPQKLVFPDEAFRATQPEPSEPRPFQLPSVQQFRLGNGVQVYLVPQTDLPVISLDLNFEGGTRNDPAGKEGMVSVCMDMLSEGTEELEKIAFNEALADVASSIGSYATSETQGVTMRTLSKHFDETFALYVDTLLRPGFRQEDFDRMIRRRLESLKQAKGSPASVAQRVSGTVLYGGAHPFGRVVTEESLAAITLDDCKRYHQRYIKPAAARLFVVGDMTEEQIRGAFGKGLTAWRGKPAASARLPAPRSPNGKLFFVNIPGAQQSTVYVMHFGPRRNAPDYFANHLMASVLGGGFSSRINMNLREDKGYSYGAFGRLSYSRNYGTFFAGTSVRSDTTRQTILELFDEIGALKAGERPVTDSEITREKNGAILGLPGQFATGRQALNMYRELVYFGLPLDYYNAYVGKISGVTIDQVMASARKHLRPSESRILVVGDAQAPLIYRDGTEDKPLMDGDEQVTLRAGLEELVRGGTLGKGTMVVMDADGKVLETVK
jgi:zinc protease